jgi:hypothetical protein
MPLKPVTYIAAVDGTNRYVINILDYTPPQTVRIQVQN